MKEILTENSLLIYNNALTNRANTYNLNTLTPYFGIDTPSGGMVTNVDTAGLFKPSQPQIHMHS